MPRKNSTPADSKNQNPVTLAEIAADTPFGNNATEKLAFALCDTLGVESPKPETIVAMGKICRKYDYSDEQIQGIMGAVTFGGLCKVDDMPKRMGRKRAKRETLDVANVADAPIVKKLIRQGCWLSATAEA